MISEKMIYKSSAIERFGLTYVVISLVLLIFRMWLLPNMHPLVYLMSFGLITLRFAIEIWYFIYRCYREVFVEDELIRFKNFGKENVQNIIDLKRIHISTKAYFYTFLFSDGEKVNVPVSGGKEYDEIREFLSKISDIKRKKINNPEYKLPFYMNEIKRPFQEF